jgi:hypothetical protein
VTSKITTTIVETFGCRTWSPLLFRVIPHRVKTAETSRATGIPEFQSHLPPITTYNTFNPNIVPTTTMGKKGNSKKDKPKEGLSIVKASPRSSNLQDAVAWAAAQEVSRSEAVKLAAATKAKRKAGISPMTSEVVRKILVPVTSPSRRPPGSLTATTTGPQATATATAMTTARTTSSSPRATRVGGPSEANRAPAQLPQPPPPTSTESAGVDRATFASVANPQSRLATTAPSAPGGENGKVSSSQLAASAAMLEDPLEASLARARAIADGFQRPRSASFSTTTPYSFLSQELKQLPDWETYKAARDAAMAKVDPFGHRLHHPRGRH